jgi:K(+)-stimulated pyrophosphate-energized sodium pump
LMPASVVIIIATLVVGFIGGIQALGGFLAGAILSSLLLALLMSNAGGLWDNAKKLIETGVHGGKGSEAHKAAVVGDTVGDPFKDTAGPSLNTMITVMSLVASLFAALIVQYNLLGMLGL